ncbi:hypothetical protein THAOC_12571 [Thalassiosira oceanica]|uniref:EF-hand domain-containing protein n=2 Tax=Thalassiosira oceanica TaxID=159749 RepID=K0SJN2_THAOC|nr:hypothetical protein THAOC_12571 [Thalassiosira oceanica]|eukprot:EJK66508.1 hypothetical protein THAOC_12571 [Thalassiosira oceanica]
MMSPYQLPEGTEVRLVGLKNPDLVGKYGRIANYVRDGERVMVKLEEGRMVKLKPKQIEAVDDGGGGGGRGPSKREQRNSFQHNRSMQSMNNSSNHSMGRGRSSSARGSMDNDSHGELMDTLKSADAMFDVADTDGDGILTAEEFEYYMKRHTNHDTQMIREAFMMIDADGNGDVTRDEVREAFLKKRRDLKGDSYVHTDEQKDKENSLLEAARDADALFSKADVDGSGQISKREFEIFMKKNTNHTDDAIHKLFDSMDVDRDGHITREEVRKAYLKEKGGGKVSFQDLLGLEDDDMAEIEDDVYNMFFLSDSFSAAFWYALMVWGLKLGLIIIIAFDLYKNVNVEGVPLFPDNADVPTNVRAAQFLLLPVNVAVQEELITTFFIYANLKWGKQILELNPGATKGKYHFANAMRFIDGLAFLFINTTLLLQATEVLGAL